MIIIESSMQRGFRTTVGILMVIQTVIVSFIASLSLILGPLVGGMAMIVGGGGASDDQFANAWWMIGLTTIAPSVLTLLLLVASVKVLNRKHPVFVMVACALFIVSYGALAYTIAQDQKTFSFAAVLPVTIPTLAIIVAFQMRSKRVVPVQNNTLTQSPN